MIEAVIIAMILSSVTLKAIGNAAVDVSFAVRGKESPRYKQAKARSWMPKKPSGAASRYWSQIWEDSWSQRLKKHEAKLADGRPDKPRGAARIFWSGLGQDARRSVLRKWDQGWTGLDEKRRSRSTRVPDGTDVVPGEVVPDAPVPSEPEPVLVDQTDGGTDLQFGTDPTDPTGTRSCTVCGGNVVVDGEICGACQYRQQQRDRYWESQGNTPPSTTPEPTGHPDPRTLQQPTQEGTTMTATTAEVTGLSTILKFAEEGAQQFRANVSITEGRAASCRQDAAAYKQMVTSTEHAVAAAQAGDVSGEAVVRMAQSVEKAGVAAAAMEKAATELALAQEQAGAAAADLEASASAYRQHLGLQDLYNANQGAGDKRFITAGQ